MNIWIKESSKNWSVTTAHILSFERCGVMQFSSNYTKRHRYRRNPTGPLNAVLLWQKLCLRVAQEFELLQLRKATTIINDNELSCYISTEFGSKNNQGGLTSLNLKNKVVQQYECDSKQCHVKIFDKNL